MALLKYTMECKSDICGKSFLILTDPNETELPYICPFCGHPSTEIDEDYDNQSKD